MGGDELEGGKRSHIADEDELWRRVHRKHLVFDDAGLRVSSAEFTDPELSVDVARLVPNGDPNFTRQGGAAVAVVTAGTARQLGLVVVHDPIPPTPDHPGNPAHALVKGQKRTKGKKLARSASLRAVDAAAEAQARKDAESRSQGI